MLFFQKSASSSPSSSPSAAVKDDDNYYTQKRLTRQRKIRHETYQDLGLQLTSHDNRLSSHPPSPDSARKTRSPPPPSSALSHPLPLPEKSYSSLFRRNSTDRVVTKSAMCRTTYNRRSFQDANGDGSNHGLRLNVNAPRSAPSSPMVSPRRSSPDQSSPPCNFIDSTKCSINRSNGQFSDFNGDCVNHKFSWLDSPRSAPASGLSSPAVSPQRSYTGDFSPSFMAPDFPDLGRHAAAPTSRVFAVKTSRSLDPSPIHPSLQSPVHNNKCSSNFSFPQHRKCLVENSKEWPETNSHLNAHPLPLPPGAAFSHSTLPSPPAIPHHPSEKPNLSLRKTQWLKGKLIGRGTYGSVYVGTNRETGALCAMKEVDIIPDDPKSLECIKQLEQEIRLLQHLEHPNIVRYYGCEIVDDHFYIYLEHVYPGAISRYVREHCGAMTESIVRNFTRHILCGLAYLHSKKTIHRDIKGANLLVNSSGIVKLADFGTAKHLSGLSYELSLKGSPHWMAPEVIKAALQKDASPDLALAVDIWSLGCTIIEMFTGKPPWGELQGHQAMFKVLNKTPPIPEAMSSEAKDFLSCCFRRNPAERPSATVLLEHPFLRNSCELNPSTCPLALKKLSINHKVPEIVSQKTLI